MYIFIRQDIPIADQLVQACHSCAEAGKSFLPDPHTHMVLIGIKNQEQLLNITNILKDNNIRYEIFWEPDDNMHHTAICTEPIKGEQRKLFKKYKLWKH